MTIRWAPTLIFAALVAVLAGRAASSPEVPAGAPFTYVPPSTFAPIDMPNADPGVDKVWIEPTAVSKLDARITLHHAAHAASLEEPALAAIAQGMPAMYASSHGQWSEVRHVVHSRPDGAKVGLIVGDLTTAENVHMQTMQLLFPDDTGSSIVTASFDKVSAERLVPEIEKSMDDAKGVKKLGKEAPGSVYLTYGLGALLVAFAAQIVFGRRRG